MKTIKSDNDLLLEACQSDIIHLTKLAQDKARKFSYGEVYDFVPNGNLQLSELIQSLKEYQCLIIQYESKMELLLSENMENGGAPDLDNEKNIIETSKSSVEGDILAQRLIDTADILKGELGSFGATLCDEIKILVGKYQDHILDIRKKLPNDL